MATDGELEIYKQHRQGQDKYIYFLLAAAGASIAFALNQTKGLALSTSQLPLGVAMAMWAGSFLCGSGRLTSIDGMLNLNQTLLQIQAGTHQLLSGPAEIPIAREMLLKNIKQVNDKTVRQAKWQLRFLILGAVSYIGWHVYEMYLRAH